MCCINSVISHSDITQILKNFSQQKCVNDAVKNYIIAKRLEPHLLEDVACAGIIFLTASRLIQMNGIETVARRQPFFTQNTLIAEILIGECSLLCAEVTVLAFRIEAHIYGIDDWMTCQETYGC